MLERDYIFLGTTTSLCPRCRAVVPAKILVRDNRVYFRKSCPDHGILEDFVCSDAKYFDRNEFTQPAKYPRELSVESSKGCPYDCGLCPEHEQHTCVGLIEITSACNLECPMCYAVSGPGGKHMSFDDYTRTVDRFVRQEGEPDVLQISGGEPTIHPEIVKMVRYAYGTPTQVVMINTNGIRLAKDPALVDALSSMRDKVEIYLQFDGFEKKTYAALRGEPLIDLKLQAIEALAKADLRTTLVCTAQHGVNLHELGAIVKFGLERPSIRGVSFQPATYVGRHIDPKDLENRATIPDVVKGIVAQTEGLFVESDFLPVPCAHPNCHSITWVWRGGGKPTPVTRLLDVTKHLSLAANTLVYTPQKAKALIATAMKNECCAPNEFLEAALAEQLTGKTMFRITLTAFLDKHIFDVRRAMKCCIAFLLPSGHTVPFCTYNTLYRDGHLALPPVRDAAKIEL